jgi:hypothetical protein
MNDSEQGLFQTLAEASGLAPIIARPVLRRALVRAGIDPQNVTATGVSRALDSIEASLRVYLPASEAAERVSAMKKLR